MWYWLTAPVTVLITFLAYSGARINAMPVPGAQREALAAWACCAEGEQRSSKCLATAGGVQRNPIRLLR